jgi:hypothetical protein
VEKSQTNIRRRNRILNPASAEAVISRPSSSTDEMSIAKQCIAFALMALSALSAAINDNGTSSFYRRCRLFS